MTATATARNIFDDKWPRVVRCTVFNCQQWGIHGADRDDVLGDAGVRLWRECLNRGVRGLAIDALLVATFTIREWDRKHRGRARRGQRHVIQPPALADPDADLLDANPAPETCICIDGVRLTLADARLDDPETVAVWLDGIDTPEVARRRGCSRQRVHQLRHRLGGRQIGREWRFPAVTGLA